MLWLQVTSDGGIACREWDKTSDCLIEWDGIIFHPIGSSHCGIVLTAGNPTYSAGLDDT